MSQLDTQPFQFDIATPEIAPLNIDLTGYINTGDAVQGTPVATLVLASTGAAISGAFQGNPAISGNVVQVTFLGSVLAPGQKYYLYLTTQINANGNKLSTRSLINVVF